MRGNGNSSPPLRAVKAGESAPEPKTVAQAAKGPRRGLLVAMRDRISVAVTSEKCPPRDLSSLTKRLADIAAEIEAIDARAGRDAPVARLRELERALAEVAPGHPLLADDIDDSFDASAI